MCTAKFLNVSYNYIGFLAPFSFNKITTHALKISSTHNTKLFFLDAYAQYSKVAADRAVKVPDQLTMEQAASTMWQGFTAHSFACSSYPIKAGDKILVHAAAGGVGNLIIQIAKNAGTQKSLRSSQLAHQS